MQQVRKTKTIGRGAKTSWFFRNRQGLEKALDNAELSASPKIWSAGCSRGQEPYTIAMLLAERLSIWRFKNASILATDIKEDVGHRVAEGVYDKREIYGILTEDNCRDLVKKYFMESDDGRFVVIPEIKNKVTFKTHDLLTERPISTDFDIITCKNVLEYFDVNEKRMIYKKFHEALKPEGIMVIDDKQRGKELEAPSNLFVRICRDCVDRVYKKRGR